MAVADYNAQDFEGQRLADLLSTLLLSTAGVGPRTNNPLMLLLTLSAVPRFHHRLRYAKHSQHALDWSGRYRIHFLGRCSALAILQQEPCTMATGEERRRNI